MLVFKILRKKTYILNGAENKDLSTEKKLILCRITKHYATILDGHLIFCAKKDRTTLKVAKDLFSHLAFTTKFR